MDSYSLFSYTVRNKGMVEVHLMFFKVQLLALEIQSDIVDLNGFNLNPFFG